MEEGKFWMDRISEVVVYHPICPDPVWWPVVSSCHWPQIWCTKEFSQRKINSWQEYVVQEDHFNIVCVQETSFLQYIKYTIREVITLKWLEWRRWNQEMLWECHYQKLRKRSNIWPCVLPSHSSTLSDTPIPTRLFKLFDEAGKSEACCQPGIRWCTSCWRNADKTFALKTTYKKPVRRKTLDSYIQRLSSPSKYSRFTYFTCLHNKQ